MKRVQYMPLLAVLPLFICGVAPAQADASGVSETQTIALSQYEPIWDEAQPFAQPPRWASPAIAYDSTREKVVVYAANPGETWERTGTQWAKVRPTGTQPPAPRDGAAMAFDEALGVTVLFGGGFGATLYDDTWAWNGVSWEQATPAASPPARSGHTLTYDPLRHVVVLFGGRNGTTSFNDVWEYDGVTWAIREPASRPPSRYVHAATYDASRGATIVFGGMSPETGYRVLRDMWLWDGSNWTEVPVDPSLRAGPLPSLVYDPVRQVDVLLTGGYGPAAEPEDMWEWDGTSWTYVQSASGFVRPRTWAVFDGSRDVLMAFRDSNTTTWEWDGTTWTRFFHPNSPEPRFTHAMAYDSARGVTVVYGGRGEFGEEYQDTWEFDGDAWTRRAPAHTPPAAVGNIAMAFDEARGESVLFLGGWMSSTWVWDGADWTEKTPEHSPPSPSFPGLFYDQTGSSVLMYSSYDSSLWSWNGVDWTPVDAPSSPPTGCWLPAVGYDSNRGVAMLAGVIDETGSYCGDTWEWDGASWSKVGTNFDTPGAGSMAFNEQMGVMYMFGYGQHTLLRWDGTTWVPAPNGEGPFGREYAGLVFDETRGELVLFGGGDYSFPTDLHNDTWTYGSPSDPPGVSAGGPYQVAEGGTVTLEAVGADPEGEALAFDWDLDLNGSFETPGQAALFSASSLDGPSELRVAVRATDTGGMSAVAETTVAVVNAPPTILSVAATADPIPLGSSASGTATFADPGMLDTHTAIWDWGDGSTSSGTLSETNGSGSVGGEHIYSMPGVYGLILTVTDKDGASAQAIHEYVVVYDASGGFATGHGRMLSPLGAYALDPSLAGTAKFGFEVRYQKGDTIPSGHTTFVFKVADMDFASTSFDWLVVAGSKAMFKGAGTINGAGEYRFMVSAIDGEKKDGDSDRFRIRIWDMDSELLVYDNQLGAADDADPVTVIEGGNIIVKKQ